MLPHGRLPVAASDSLPSYASVGRIVSDNQMRTLAPEIVRRCAAGERVGLCTVVATKGSTPQKRGAAMLVLADGRTLGTLGGGCVEAEVRRRALELLADPVSTARAYRFSLDQDYGWDDGLICGGVMDIAVQPLGPADAAPFADLADRLTHDRPAQLDIPYDLDGRRQVFRQELGPPPVLLIVGAGHVGQALAKLAVDLNFRVDVLDDRADHLSPERFPAVRARLVGDIQAELARYPLDPDTFVTVITRGHRHDATALHAVVRRPHRYVGLIGSKRKIKAIFDEVHRAGVPAADLARVHGPIGLDIAAETVPEIALSIAAELVAVRRGREDVPAGPMKMPIDEVGRWLARPNNKAADSIGG
jgi:xanthine dehydrogenase accessory factor